MAASGRVASLVIARKVATRLQARTCKGSAGRITATSESVFEVGAGSGRFSAVKLGASARSVESGRAASVRVLERWRG